MDFFLRHADCLSVELEEEVEARAEAIRALLPVLYASQQEGQDGRQAQTYLISLVRAAICDLVQLFERNQLRGGSKTGEFLNNMDAVLEAESDGLTMDAFNDKAKALVRHALTVAAAASGGHREDDRDISVICKNIVERLGQLEGQSSRLELQRLGELEGQSSRLELQRLGELEGQSSRLELQRLLELLEERVNSALLRQVTDHLSCVDLPLDTLVHR